MQHIQSSIASSFLSTPVSGAVENIAIHGSDILNADDAASLGATGAMRGEQGDRNEGGAILALVPDSYQDFVDNYAGWLKDGFGIRVTGAETIYLDMTNFSQADKASLQNFFESLLGV